MGSHLRSGRWPNRVFSVAIWCCAAVVTAAFLWLLYDVVAQGIQQISWEFLFEEPVDSGRSGGIGPILVATLLILAVALAVALPLGLGCAIWLAEFTRADTPVARIVSMSLDALAGVPSIVFGLFGYAFFCGFLGLGFSILSGGLTLTCMMLPLLIRTAEAGLNAVPDEWRHGAAALGMSKTALLWHVLLPCAAPAITAGLLLAMGRATAETAALIFTSGYVDRMPASLHDSGRALAVHIYDLSMNVSGGDSAAYSSALVLILLIVAIHLIASQLLEKWFSRRVTR